MRSQHTQSWQHWMKANWFVVVALLMITCDLSASKLASWPNSRWLEAGMLIDFAVLLPILYWVCYRARGKAAIIRAVALSSLAIWAVGKILPLEQHHLLEQYGFIRYFGMAGLALIELKIAVGLYKAIIRSEKSSEQMRAELSQNGVPPWVAQLMAWEAMVWKKVFGFFKKK